MAGVFNQQQHEEEIQLLLKGSIRQFQLLRVPTDQSSPGLVTIGSQQGLFEYEGNSLFAIADYLDKDYTHYTGTSAATPVLYVKFNQLNAPWLPIGIAASGNVLFPSSYVLTFGRFWLYSLGGQAGGSFIPLVVGKGVCLYSQGLGPTVVGAYQAPTWMKYA